MASDSNDVMVLVEEKTKKKRAENIIIENYYTNTRRELYVVAGHY